MNTIVPPTSVHGCSRQLFAVTWKSGVGAMNTGGVGGSGGRVGRRALAGGAALASASATTCAMNAMFSTLCTEPRCVSWAPFGAPVVPDV